MMIINSKKFLLGWLVFIVAALGFAANTDHIPQWWVDRGIISSKANELESSTIDDNYAAANLGQLMFIATRAKEELDFNYPGSSTPASIALTNLINGFVQNNTVNTNNPNPDFNIENNYKPLNIGQLKYVARHFFDRLAELPRDEFSRPVKMKFVGGNGKYPWLDLPDANSPEYESAMKRNYDIATIGQIKNLFSWSLRPKTDENNNEIPDWWERQHFGGLISNPNADISGNGISILDAYKLGLDPNVNHLNPAEMDYQMDEIIYDGNSMIIGIDSMAISRDKEGNITIITK